MLKSNLRKHLRNVHHYPLQSRCECGANFENSQSLNAHYRHCLIHRNGKPVVPPGTKGKPSPHKGLKLEDYSLDPATTRERLAIASTGRPVSKETREKLSKAAIENIGNGIGYSYGHKGRYDGFWFDSAWELAYYWYHKSSGVQIIKNRTEKLSYVDDAGNTRYTIPDFIVNGRYVEIKGFPSYNLKCKIDQLSDKIQFLFGKDLKVERSAIVAKYGKKFHEVLYSMPS